MIGILLPQRIQKAVETVIMRCVVQMARERQDRAARLQHLAHQARGGLPRAVVIHPDKAKPPAARHIRVERNHRDPLLMQPAEALPQLRRIIGRNRKALYPL